MPTKSSPYSATLFPKLVTPPTSAKEDEGITKMRARQERTLLAQEQQATAQQALEDKTAKRKAYVDDLTAKRVARDRMPEGERPDRQPTMSIQERDNRFANALGGSSALDTGMGLGDKRSLESDAGRMSRSARRLRRMGYGNAAEQMALASETERVNTPATRSQEYRKAQDELSDQAAAGAGQVADMQGKYLDSLLDRLGELEEPDELDDEGKPYDSYDSYEEWLEDQKVKEFGNRQLIK